MFLLGKHCKQAHVVGDNTLSMQTSICMLWKLNDNASHRFKGSDIYFKGLEHVILLE